MSLWKKFLREDDGPTIVEYAILLALIILVSVTTLGSFGVGIHNVYTVIDGSLPN